MRLLFNFVFDHGAFLPQFPLIVLPPLLSRGFILHNNVPDSLFGCDRGGTYSLGSKAYSADELL